MGRIAVFSDDAPLTPRRSSSDPTETSDILRALNVRLEQWQTLVLQADATEADICSAYQADIARLKQSGGYRVVDVVKVRAQHGRNDALRKSFLREHTHGDDEVRFFVEGGGTFYLHVNGQVYAVTCGRGDLLSVPAGMPHWFDMGDVPHLTALRLFRNPEGWVATYTGSEIAADFLPSEGAGS
jgi:1,2-dihydroxy-3-keto-5-methylthiopentene dioxygenase